MDNYNLKIKNNYKSSGNSCQYIENNKEMLGKHI